MKSSKVFLDYQSTTQCDKRVIEKMLPYLKENFGNPHSKSHVYGWECEKAVEEAREKVAKCINAKNSEIIFTSGATEANNLALQGCYNFYKSSQKNHIITCKTEHMCVLQTCKFLEKNGAEVTYLNVNYEGIIDINEFEKSIKKNTLLVSIMTAHNEIGVIQNIEEIGKICHKKNIFFHTDASQAVGKIPIDVKKCNINLLSISSHKMHGPQGVGALYVGKNPRIRLSPLFHGGNQERGMRSGTLPVHLCVGFGEACEIAVREMNENYIKIKELHEYTKNQIITRINDAYINGSVESRMPHNLNISFAYIEGEALMMSMEDFAISSGSACTSSSLEGSYVLKAMGISDLLIHSSIRIGFSKYTEKHQIDKFIDKLDISVQKLREMSPLYEMSQEGIDLEEVQWKDV